jgi:RsiW-degrading membrane proteinase PrsW (M82 family)
MTRFDSRLIAPPEKEEIYPYRRAWRSVIIESGIVFAATVIVFVLWDFVGVTIPDRFQRLFNLTLAMLPLASWLIFSLLAERGVPQPRHRLIYVMSLSALVANAIGYPLVHEFFQVDRWLPLQSAVNRIIGYAFTVGITQELLKYLVVRILVWPDYFETWLDGIAYSAASAVGYATILNLHFVFSTDATPDVAALQLLGTYTVQLTASMIVGYGLSDLRFNRSSLLLMPLTFALGAFITGVAIPIRAGLINASLSLASLEVTAPRPILSLGFSLGLFVALLFVLSFLFRNAEYRQREAQESREV